MEKQVLNGGREGKIVREADIVVRPANVWTPQVHAFLAFLRERGFPNVPAPYGIGEDGRERVSFVEGEVYPDGLPEALGGDAVLLEAAELLRRYHELGAAYVERLSGGERWMLPARSPAEVMCHGDFAPYNVTFRDGHVHGLIDFDTLHPGPRLWDFAYAAYRWVPLMAPGNPECRGDPAEQLRRLRLFAERYGLRADEGERLPAAMTERLRSLIAYMESEARSGNEDMRRNIEAGHLALYERDIAYFEENAGGMTAALRCGRIKR